MAYNEDNEEFEYTDCFTADSSFIDDVYYDKDARELLVCLDSGRVYLYHNVPVDVYNDFERGAPLNWFSAPSVGRFYNSKVKRNYGPSIEVADNVEPVEKQVPAPVTTSVTISTPNQTWTVPSATFDLRPRVPEPETPALVKRKHRIDFTVEGGNEVKSYTVEAVGVTEATDMLIKQIHALGLTLRIKGVYVDFE